jgi:hypothetical protein
MPARQGTLQRLQSADRSHLRDWRLFDAALWRALIGQEGASDRRVEGTLTALVRVLRWTPCSHRVQRPRTGPEVVGHLVLAGRCRW